MAFRWLKILNDGTQYIKLIGQWSYLKWWIIYEQWGCRENYTPGSLNGTKGKFKLSKILSTYDIVKLRC